MNCNDCVYYTSIDSQKTIPFVGYCNTELKEHDFQFPIFSAEKKYCSYYIDMSEKIKNLLEEICLK